MELASPHCPGTGSVPTHCAQMPAGAAAVGQRVHNLLDGGHTLGRWGRGPHGRGRVGDPGAPVILRDSHRPGWVPPQPVQPSPSSAAGPPPEPPPPTPGAQGSPPSLTLAQVLSTNSSTNSTGPLGTPDSWPLRPSTPLLWRGGGADPTRASSSRAGLAISAQKACPVLAHLARSSPHAGLRP